MVLDGIEGFTPTQNQNKNVTNSNRAIVKEKMVKVMVKASYRKRTFRLAFFE
jgi:hypothetical protein